MSKLRELAAEVAKMIDPEADFLLIVRPREVDPQTGQKRSVVATNVGRPAMDDMIVTGTSTYVMDQVFKQRMEQRSN
jgi:hypothetical protein